MNSDTVSGAGVRRLLNLAFPLMLTWLSTTAMMFADRVLLAHYSLEALGAAVNAGTVAWGFAYGFQIVTEMAQVVVAQYHGAGQGERLTAPTWQVLWLALASVPVFLVLALVGAPLFFDVGSLQAVYFRYMVLFGPVFGLIGAGSSYFMGRGEGRMVTVAAVIGNLVNLVLDWVLIFGVDGLLDPMGIKGAAIATGLGMSVQAGILLAVFMRRSRGCAFWPSWKELRPCLRVGLPPGLFMGVELIGWGFFFSMMAEASEEHLQVTGICHSLLPLLACVGIGLQKGTASLGGQLIGAGEMGQLGRLIRSGLTILASYIALLSTIFLLFPEPVISLFSGTQNQGLSEHVEARLRMGLMLSCGYLLFGGIRCLISGLLAAAADTWFMTWAGTLSVWLLLLAPTYIVVVQGGGSVTVAQSLLVAYGAATALIYTGRYLNGAWRARSSLIDTA